MHHLQASDLLSLEEYHRQRPEFRSRIMAHKKLRQVAIGPNATLYFEDRLTIQYQIQEMLRIEKVFEADGIEDELEAYNPLIPDGSNWKATFMIEVPDEQERRGKLVELKGIENDVWVRIDGFEPVFASADEDLERENEEKTSSVHFLRFELTPAMVEAARNGAGVGAGITHSAYTQQLEPLPENIRLSLLGDLD